MQRSLYGAIISLISILSITTLYADESTGSVQVDSWVTNSGSTYTGTVMIETGFVVSETGSLSGTVTDSDIPIDKGGQGGLVSGTGTTDTGSVAAPLVSVQSLLSQPTTITSPSPTIHQVPGYGNWNDPASWSENRIPTADDIVEINGIMNLNSSPTITGLVVNAGGQLLGSYYTIILSGNIENNGNITTNIVFSWDIVVYGSVTIGWSLNFNNHSITIDSGKSLTVKWQITGSGTFLWDNISLNTYGNFYRANISGSGLHTNMYGTSITIHDFNFITKTLTVHSWTSITNWYGPYYGHAFRMDVTVDTFLIESGATIDVNDFLKVQGNIINNGTIQWWGSVYTYGNIENNGVWSIANTQASGSWAMSIIGSSPINWWIILLNDITINKSSMIGWSLNFNNHSQ